MFIKRESKSDQSGGGSVNPATLSVLFICSPLVPFCSVLLLRLGRLGRLRDVEAVASVAGQHNRLAQCYTDHRTKTTLRLHYHTEAAARINRIALVERVLTYTGHVVEYIRFELDDDNPAGLLSLYKRGEYKAESLVVDTVLARQAELPCLLRVDYRGYDRKMDRDHRLADPLNLDLEDTGGCAERTLSDFVLLEDRVGSIHGHSRMTGTA